MDAIATNGATAEMGSSMVDQIHSRPPRERDRRKARVEGTPIRLSNGEDWVIAYPQISIKTSALSQPNIDEVIDRIYDSVVLDQTVALTDAWIAARVLLLENYYLDDEELGDLLSVADGSESIEFVHSLIACLLGDSAKPSSYIEWVRATLIANGIGADSFSMKDLPAVLSILVATNRAISPFQSIDAHLAMSERNALEGLV